MGARQEARSASAVAALAGSGAAVHGTYSWGGLAEYRMRVSMVLPLRVGFTLAIVMLHAVAADAALGGLYQSVEQDRTHLAAAMRSATMATHMVHTLTSENGGVVREFTRSDGTVFAVAWHGPGRPDLRQLLGSSFDSFQAAVTTGRVVRTRAPLVVHKDDLVVQSAGRPGAFRGIAYLPRLVPPGFSAEDLRQ